MGAKLSPKAIDIIEKLQSEINQVINADRVREPKLTAEEKQEIATLEGVIAKYTAARDRIEKQLEDTSTQLDTLRINYFDLIVDEKKTAEIVASELNALPVLLDLLREVHREAAHMVGLSEIRIKGIKEIAREREVTNAG